MLAELLAWSPDLIITCAADGPRSIAAERLAQRCEALGVASEVGGSVVDSMGRAVDLSSDDDAIVVTGSLRVVAEARAAMARIVAEVGRAPRESR